MDSKCDAFSFLSFFIFPSFFKPPAAGSPCCGRFAFDRELPVVSFRGAKRRGNLREMLHRHSGLLKNQSSPKFRREGCGERPALTGDSCAQRTEIPLLKKSFGLFQQLNRQRPSRSSSWQACRRWRRYRRGAAAQTGCSGSSYRPPPSCGSRRPRRRTTSCG